MKFIFIAISFFLSSNLLAQQKMEADATAVKNIDGIVKEVLRIISGEEGKVRDWDAFANLFLPSATFTVHSHDDSVSLPVETVSLQEFITLMDDPYYDRGFLEQGIDIAVNEYNGIAQVFQSYYARDSEGYEEEGINSYQLVYFNDRWWIANLLWTGDSNGVKVPDKYK